MLPPPVCLSNCQNITWQATSKPLLSAKTDSLKTYGIWWIFLLWQQLGCNYFRIGSGNGNVGSVIQSHTGPHLVCPHILFLQQIKGSLACWWRPNSNLFYHKWRQTNRCISPCATDDSHNMQHIFPHLFRSGWLQTKQPQSKNKSTSTPSASISLDLIQKPPKALQG